MALGMALGTDGGGGAGIQHFPAPETFRDNTTVSACLKGGKTRPREKMRLVTCPSKWQRKELMGFDPLPRDFLLCDMRSGFLSDTLSFNPCLL